MAEKNYHPIPGFIASLTGFEPVDITYQGKVCPDPLNLYRYDYGLPASQKLPALLFAAEGGTWTVGINIQDDKVFIQSDDGNDFQINSTPTAIAMGFRNFPVVGVLVGSVIRAYATADWQRGDFEGDPISITMTAGPTLIATDPVGHLTHLMQWLSPEVGTDNNNDPISANFRFGINSEGHCFFTSNEGSPGTPNFCPVLGFTGNEVAVSGDTFGVGPFFTYTATYPMTGVWVPSRPLARRIQETEQDTDSTRTLSGKHVYAHRGSFTSLSLEAWVDGPQDSKDLYKHVLERFAPFAHPGARIDYYARWGDPRLPLQDYEVGLTSFPYTITSANYNNGELGVVRCYAGSEMGSVIVTWPQDLRRRSPLTLILKQAHNLED
jgi:hypothetical protein